LVLSHPEAAAVSTPRLKCPMESSSPGR
jgi:hypothetical protein